MGKDERSPIAREVARDGTGRIDVNKLVDNLTLAEKCLLTCGSDIWTTAAVERLGIPSIKMSDGPSGVRGSGLPGASTGGSVCIPCGSALGATWNPGLVEKIGEILGEQARAKSARVVLAPTMNLHRAPLSGRNFESYSEDPFLSGKLAAAEIRGIQSRGVAATAKHFAANETEFERYTASSEVDERTLREIYLLPFEMAVIEGGVMCIMTAYNRLNGTYCSENGWLIAEVLKGDWGFDGLVMTDWFAAGSTVASSLAGLDMEMPGPGRFYGPALEEAVRSGAVDESRVDDKVSRLLMVMGEIGAFDDPMHPEPESSLDLPSDRELVRRAAADSIVLLRNENGILPLDGERTDRIAVIGPNASRAIINGGGSASLQPHYRITPVQALRERLGGSVEVGYEPGCLIDRSVPLLDGRCLSARDGRSGLDISIYANENFEGRIVSQLFAPDSRLVFFGSPAAGEVGDVYSLRAETTFTPLVSGDHLLTLVQAGRARLLLDDEVVLDGFADPPPQGDQLFGMGSQEMTAEVHLVEGRTVRLQVEYSTIGSVVLKGAQIGCRPPVSDDLLGRAVALAEGADLAVVVVGTTEEWESEGYDRDSLSLPGEQNDLVEAILAANPNTVVVVNAGAPVALPWALRTRALLQIWFGGQEMGSALADVLVGRAEPGGRLPMTIPARLEHSPAFGNFPGENGQVRYGEGLFVGYRWYESRQLPVCFPFGHGLSYTAFELGEPVTSSTSIRPDQPIRIEVPVSNIGARPGCEVVQCYVRPLNPRLVRPFKELKGFAKIELDPGERATVSVELTPRAFAYWDPGDAEWADLAARQPVWMRHGEDQRRRAPGWYLDEGHYEIHVGRSSADVAHVISVAVDSTSRLSDHQS